MTRRKLTVFLATGGVLALAAVAGAPAAVQALITGAQIKDGTIESRDIRNGTIRQLDLTAGAIASLRGARGAQGATGATGATGPTGPAGPAGPQGAQGPQGPAGTTGPAGAKGDKGDPGAGLHVTGSVATAGDLPATADEGDAYLVTSTGHLWVWNGTAFVDAGAVQGPQGPAGATGPQGPAGPQGATGPTGPAGGLTGYEIVDGDAVVVSESDFEVSGDVACPAGKVVLGGGVDTDDASVDIAVSESYPWREADTYGWAVTLYNTAEAANVFTPYAICANTA